MVKVGRRDEERKNLLSWQKKKTLSISRKAPTMWHSILCQGYRLAPSSSVSGLFSVHRVCSVLGGRADWGLQTSCPYLQFPEIISQAAKLGKTSVGGCGWTHHTLVIVPGERQAREEAEKWEMTLFNLLAVNSSTCLKLKCSALPSPSSATGKISVSSAFGRRWV